MDLFARQKNEKFSIFYAICLICSLEKGINECSMREQFLVNNTVMILLYD